MVQVQTGDTTTTTYDAYGNTKTITSPNENVTALNYDALNRRIQQTDSDGPVGTWSYDPVGNVVSTTDGDGNPTSYSYDALNRRVTMTDALNNVTAVFLRSGQQSVASAGPQRKSHHVHLRCRLIEADGH